MYDHIHARLQGKVMARLIINLLVGLSAMPEPLETFSYQVHILLSAYSHSIIFFAGFSVIVCNWGVLDNVNNTTRQMITI